MKQNKRKSTAANAGPRTTLKNATVRQSVAHLRPSMHRGAKAYDNAVNVEAAALIIGTTADELLPHVRSGALPNFTAQVEGQDERLITLIDLDHWAATSNISASQDKDSSGKTGLPHQQMSDANGAKRSVTAELLPMPVVEALIENLRSNSSHPNAHHTEAEREHGYETLRLLTRLSNQIVTTNPSTATIESLERAFTWLALFAKAGRMDGNTIAEKLHEGSASPKADDDTLGYCAIINPAYPLLPDGYQEFGVITRDKTELKPVYYSELTSLMTSPNEFYMDRAAIEEFEKRIAADSKYTGYTVNVHWRTKNVGEVTLAEPEEVHD